LLFQPLGLPQPRTIFFGKTRTATQLQLQLQRFIKQVCIKCFLRHVARYFSSSKY
jgi:hypothetical protein